MTPSIRQTIVVFVALSVIVTTGVPVAATGHDTGLAFAESPIIVERGDTGTIRVNTPVDRTVLITIRGATTDYEVQTAVTDRNRDGRVALRMNTHRAGRTSTATAAYSTTDSDRLEYARRPTQQRSTPLPEGRYNVIISTPSSSVAGVLQLTAGDLHGGTSYTTNTPRTIQSDSTTQLAKSIEVARGDVAVSRFNVSGIGELIDDPPSSNIVRARDSTASARTSHLVRVTVSQNRTLRQLAINYDAGDGNIPLNVQAGSVATPTIVGVDTDADGSIERRPTVTASEITIATQFTSGPQFTFASPIELRENESLYVRVPMTNPSAEGSDTVNLVLNDEITHTGEIAYGVAGTGSLGYGVDLQVRAGNQSVINPVAAVTMHYNDTANRLHVAQPTTQFSEGRYRHSLRLLDAYPYGNRSWASAEFNVTSPRATIQVQNRSQATTGRHQLQLRIETNLAPGRNLRIHIADDTGTQQKLIIGTVNERQQLKETISVSSTTNRTVFVSYDGTQISDNVAI